MNEPKGLVHRASPPPPLSAKRMTPIDRSKVDPTIVKAAEGLEAMFINTMIESMRKTIPKNELDLDSNAGEIYRGMFDTEIAERAAKTGGMGLADQIIAYLLTEQYNQSYPGPGSDSPKPEAAPVRPSTGGTHESK